MKQEPMKYPGRSETLALFKARAQAAAAPRGSAAPSTQWPDWPLCAPLPMVTPR